MQSARDPDLLRKHSLEEGSLTSRFFGDGIFSDGCYDENFLGHDNFTRFDNLPFEQWPKPEATGSAYEVVGW